MRTAAVTAAQCEAARSDCLEEGRDEALCAGAFDTCAVAAEADDSLYGYEQRLLARGRGLSGRDVEFTVDMLSVVAADLCIDTSRVLTMGFSFGGAISYKLACVRSDKFRAALVYDTGPVSGNDASECTKPIAFLQTHGTDDQTFNYQTGLSVLDIFVQANGCTAMTPPTPPQDGHTCTEFDGCAAGYPVRFCNFGSGENDPYDSSLRGHDPSPKDPEQSTSWVPAETWDFIQRF